MALAIPSFTITMLDAEYARLNQGIAAPTVVLNGSFGNGQVGYGNLPAGSVSAASAAGTTTVTLNSGFRTDGNIRILTQRARRGAQLNQFTFTP
jgi:hypothetical protein